MSYAKNGKVRLHWQQAGSGTPVVLVMGHVYSSELWYPLLPSLQKRFQVTWFDNRGTGRSSATRHATATDLVNDTLAVMDAAGVGSAHLVGVSMGGGIVLKLAAEHPDRVRSLVLGCTALREQELPPARWRDGLRYHVPRPLLKRVLTPAMYGPACAPDDAEKDLEVLVQSRFSARGLKGQAEAIRSYDMNAARAAQVTVPALVQHGTADTTVPFALGQQLAAALPDARFLAYEGAGHNYLVAAPQSRTDLLDFLETADDGAALPSS